MAYAELAAECERLARDFGRLALADVSGAIVTERSLTWCRRPIPRVRDNGRLIARITAKPRQGVITGYAEGCELGDIAPQTAEEELSASVWYGPIESEPFVNSAGQSMVMESGWETLHEWELTGTNASHAHELLERAGEWTLRRWRWLSRLLWPGRGTEAGKHCWPDVVNQVSELARDATLPRPEWSVIVGKYRAWWPVSMWKTRDEWQLGEPQYTAEDVERIGEDPEVVLAARKHWLRDSETALEWLAKQLSKEQTVGPVVVAVDPQKEIRAEALAAVVASGFPGMIQAAVSVPAGSRVAEIMRSMCANDAKYYSWTADEWANHLKASKPTITGCDAWLEIMQWREAKKQSAMSVKTAAQKAESSRRKQHKKLPE